MLKRRQQLWYLPFFLLLLSSTVRAQKTVHQLSLKEAVEFAKKNNGQVKNALASIQIQEQVNREVTSAALPQLNGTIGATHFIDVPTQVVPGNFIPGGAAGTLLPLQMGVKNNASAGVSLSQILFDGQVFIGLKARKTAIEMATKNAAVTEESIKVNVYKIYYQLVVSKTQIELLDANISRIAKLNHDVNEIYKNGFAEKLDVDKTEVQLANLKTERLKALNAIGVGYLGLKTLLGIPAKDSLVLTDKITDEEIKQGVLSDSVSYTDRKDYAYLQSVKRLNEFNIRRYKLAYLPTISLNGSYTRQAMRNKFDYFGKGDWYPATLVGLNINIPIFDGFSKDAKIKQSKLEVQQIQNNIDMLELSINSEMEQAKLNYLSAIETMDFQKKNMQLAENVYNQTKKKFEVGTGDNTEINTAQTDFKTAQTNYISALYDATIAKVDYLKAIGKLPY